ncbi:hypothetical protein [Mesorhizobium sp. M0254]|uniref:hypothetical protein n=1 Tax=Mesorhizobium sp. M0254 TaxID=2956927 RepID=UPI00333BE88B
MAKPDIYMKVASALLIDPLPSSARMKLLLDKEFCNALGLRPKLWFPLKSGLSVEADSLHNALRAAVAGRRLASVTLKDGRHARAKLSTVKGGRATLTLMKEGYAFSNADLLSEQRELRLNGLKRIFAAQPLSVKDEDNWRKIAEERALTDSEYDELMTTLSDTPEAFSDELHKPKELSASNMMPDSPSYYYQLVGQLNNSTDLESFIRDELAATRTSAMGRNRSRASRRIAFSALWQPLIPFELLSSLTAAELTPLLTAEDPFSLLFGFELCCSSVEVDSTYVTLGISFLEKLFGDMDSAQRRSEIFAACALIAMTRIRQSARAASAPVFWIRLVALAHAGVLADALAGMPDPKGFLRWATNRYFASYTWHGVVDRHEAPRWRPEWISPDHIFAELVGRARGALFRLTEESRPESWVSTIDAAAKRLIDDGNMLTTIFPGPFDDFRKSELGTLLDELIADVEAQLDKATHFNEAQGLTALAYTTVPSGRAIANVLRIFSLTANEPVSEPESELLDLRIVAHVALAARSEPVAEAVINRCFTLALGTSGPNFATAIFAVMAESCAVHDDDGNYRRALGDAAARLCFLLERPEDLAELNIIFKLLTCRDEKLTPSLAKARAIANTKMLAA